MFRGCVYTGKCVSHTGICSTHTHSKHDIADTQCAIIHKHSSIHTRDDDDNDADTLHDDICIYIIHKLCIFFCALCLCLYVKVCIVNMLNVLFDGAPSSRTSSSLLLSKNQTLSKLNGPTHPHNMHIHKHTTHSTPIQHSQRERERKFHSMRTRRWFSFFSIYMESGSASAPHFVEWMRMKGEWWWNELSHMHTLEHKETPPPPNRADENGAEDEQE